MTSAVSGDRRSSGAAPAEVRLAGRLRRGLAALRSGLFRPLAEDDDRVAYLVRHIRYGIVLSELSALAVLIYSLFTETEARHSPWIFALAAVVVAGCPPILLLPLRDMLLDRRGPVMFYLWTLATTAVIIIATALDGGAESPLDAMLFLTLTYMAVTYSPHGVVAMGTAMTVSYVLAFGLSGLTSSAAFFVVLLIAFTLICTMASVNAWAAHERQTLLISTQRALAATDPLTGIPNRRLFLERLADAVDAAASGARAVVCLVDLDGFKAVNDRAGHGAGDALLQSVASVLGTAVRETDTVARFGGDEFAVLADVTEDFSSEMLAERLRTAVARVGLAVGVTASIGVAEVRAGYGSADLLHRADDAMYRAKAAGGDRVVHQPA
ncbi:GGDEF domain-containing protein [Candidatus Blastococcus massiliensis]|uniref:GGDEF domain-containing protein n=1 Tax=Candidatus Blastococcus massiliensis TaxID=1470358 RepID=UPI0012DE15CF|nr:GGDEF domain-containing protein [Candidatus Blastococcus massiliensis]